MRTCDTCDNPVSERRHTQYACFDCEPQWPDEIRAELDKAKIATLPDGGSYMLSGVFVIFCDGRKWELKSLDPANRQWTLWSDDERPVWSGSHADKNLIRMLGGKGDEFIL